MKSEMLTPGEFALWRVINPSFKDATTMLSTTNTFEDYRRMMEPYIRAALQAAGERYTLDLRKEADHA